MCHMDLDAAKEGDILTFLSLNTCFLEFEIADKVRNLV